MTNMPCHEEFTISGVGKVEGVHLLIPKSAGMLYKQAFEYGLLNHLACRRVANTFRMSLSSNMKTGGFFIIPLYARAPSESNTSLI